MSTIIIAKDYKQVTITSLKDKPITNWHELAKSGHSDGQESGTFEGTILLDGQRRDFRKHWSNNAALVGTEDALFTDNGTLRYIIGQWYYKHG